MKQNVNEQVNAAPFWGGQGKGVTLSKKGLMIGPIV